jgi:hypothetical protein
MNDNAAAKAGQALVDLLNLKKDTVTNRYKTQWGEKTVVGLGRVIARIVRESNDV